MLEDIKILEARLLALEGVVELLLGKAIADSGHTLLALEELQAENKALGPEHAGNPVIVAVHQELIQAMADRAKGGHRSSLRFPRQWKRRPRRR